MIPGVRLVVVDGVEVGLVGLDEAFAELEAAGIRDPAERKAFLLSRVRQKNYVPPRREAAYADALLEEYLVWAGERPARRSASPKVRVLGPGCPSCQALERLVLGVLSELGLGVDFEHVRDPREIGRYGVFASPALVVGDRLLVSGRVPGREELKKLLVEGLQSG
ncbi:MAG: thioredoxin family protein [Bacillota bacterium]|nr:thioredoxin family protein [Bacillota bacterium]